MVQPSAEQSLALARQHLARVQQAAVDPIDWTDLSTYAFYSLEAAVMAAATHSGSPADPNHPSKARAARSLAAKYGIPDVSLRLSELNTARKAVAYGDTAFPPLDAQDVATEVEEFVDAVEALILGPES